MSFNRFKGRGPVPDSGAPGNARINPLRGPAGYRASPELAKAVNVALTLQMPLLVTGEPGTGKTELAYRIAAELGLGEVLRFDTKSSSQASELFYQFDNVRQFAQSQLQAASGKELPAAHRFVRIQALGRAILRTRNPSEVADRFGPDPEHTRPVQSVVLIDELDKAPRDFPNDLLNQIENREFVVPELGVDQPVQAHPDLPPVLVITSNSEKQLPEAFLRRCVYHHISFPKDRTELEQILAARLGQLDLKGPAFGELLGRFLDVRAIPNLQKPPSTSELLDWMRALSRAGLEPGKSVADQESLLRDCLGSLLKIREDQDLYLRSRFRTS